MIIVLVESFRSEFQVRGRTVFQSQSGLVATDVLQFVGFVHIIAFLVLEPHDGIRRQFVVTSQIGIQIHVSNQAVR